jgi:hypothetical protein
MYSKKQRAKNMSNYIKAGVINILSNLMSAAVVAGLFVYFVS